MMLSFSTAAAALAFASTVSAHATMFSVWVNGEDQGDGRNVYIRSPTSNSPVKDLTSADLVCNDKGSTEVTKFVTAAAGDTLSFEWYHDNRGDDIIASSHKGPIITYVAPYTSGDGTGAIWSKIDEEGYDSSTKLWAVDNLISNKGLKDFTIPSGLAAGKYLFRQEIIALHEADAAFNQNSARGAQFYPSCVQIEVTGSGTVTPSENFDFNTGYTYSDPGILFNLYGSFTSYPIPGPDVIDASGSGSGSGNTATSAAATSAAATSAAATSAATSKAAAATTTGVSSKAAVATSSAAPTTLATLTKPATSAQAATSATAKASPTACGQPRIHYVTVSA